MLKFFHEKYQIDKILIYACNQDLLLVTFYVKSHLVEYIAVIISGET